MQIGNLCNECLSTNCKSKYGLCHYLAFVGEAWDYQQQDSYCQDLDNWQQRLPTTDIVFIQSHVNFSTLIVKEHHLNCSQSLKIESVTPYHTVYTNTALWAQVQAIRIAKPSNLLAAWGKPPDFLLGIPSEWIPYSPHEKGVNPLKTGANRLWNSWKVEWSKHMSEIRACKSSDSNKVGNDDSFDIKCLGEGNQQSWLLFLPSSIILKGELCSFFCSLGEVKAKLYLRWCFCNKINWWPVLLQVEWVVIWIVRSTRLYS